MHPAERELINGTLEQMESCCRTLRRYLAFAQRSEAQPVPTSPSYDDDMEGDPAEKLEDRQLETMLGRMMGIPGSGGGNVPPTL
jgi:hypothetical protein